MTLEGFSKEWRDVLEELSKRNLRPGNTAIQSQGSSHGQANQASQASAGLSCECDHTLDSPRTEPKLCEVQLRADIQNLHDTKRSLEAKMQEQDVALCKIKARFLQLSSSNQVCLLAASLLLILQQ